MPLALGAGVMISELANASKPVASGAEEVDASAWICESTFEWLSLLLGLMPSGLLAEGFGSSSVLESGPTPGGNHEVKIIVMEASAEGELRVDTREHSQQARISVSP